MKKSILVLALLFIFACGFSQNKLPIFVGFQPSVTVEKFYDKGEFDINIIPLVVEFPIAKRIDFRFANVANYHFGGNNKFSDIGFQILTPIFFKKKNERDFRSYGFYASPVLGLGYNFRDNHYTATFALELGYLFETKKRFTLTLGIQLGGSYLINENSESEWVQHFGFKINLGFWLR